MRKTGFIAYTSLAIEYITDRQPIPDDVQEAMKAAGVNIEQVRKYVEGIIGKPRPDTE